MFRGLGLGVLVTVVALLSTNAIYGHEIPEEEHDDPIYVSPPEQPTEVKVGLYLIGIDEISPASDAFPTFEAELFMDLMWKDPRLAFDPKQLGGRKRSIRGRKR